MSKDRPVLVLTCVDDPTSDVVIHELNNRGVPVVRCDPADVLACRLDVAACFGGDARAGYLQTESRRLDLSAVRSVYYRRPSSYAAPRGMSVQDGRFSREQAKHGMGGILANIRGRWVNHIWRAIEAEFKPTQLAVAGEVGFAVPKTLITNNLDAARDFAKDQGQIIYKPLQNSELTRADGNALMVWTDLVSPGELDESVSLTMHLFQECVDKVADVRTTVIGDQIFSVRIDSPYLDWRQDYDQVTYAAVDTPPQITDACRRYLARFGLLFGAFDFGIGQDGSWVWYECNTGGQWHWLELETGLPMTAALADLLEIR
ncbi:ATP-grasp ribosomal peptide maturase [Kribbella sandramycini]|uniref:ATP-grasp ribosomal peptide maturase n=1 Tax=Kribbella sandramycini TaxID=60450 RepID=A0A7Y4P061_9ACTN|nr:ATP-grasp ribosomal peptide maturase [Kribbella sandramycini]MBB6569451.1 ATP-grasp ribosomal peptide maturase [Kribbella sandramycini]NOL40714.1 ATP-grasp ribosomal peptide maturase [Kribbella sandramycini]